MNTTKKRYRHAILLLFALNAAFLAWAILWKCGVPYIGTASQRAINLIPFHGNTNWEMQFNVLLFVPLGFFLAAVMPAKMPVKPIYSTVLASAILEAMQYVLAVGLTDVTDIVLNALGGVIGIAAYLLLSRLFGRHFRKAVATVCLLIVTFEFYVSVSYILYGYVRIGHVMYRM